MLALGFLDALALDGVELSLTLVRDARIRELNRVWRRVDEATDVLSFPVGETPGPGPRMLGDVVISTQTARRRAKELGTTLDAELALYLAHGVLHLLGFDHHTRREAKLMGAAERKLLGAAGMLGRSGEAGEASGRSGR